MSAGASPAIATKPVDTPRRYWLFALISLALLTSSMQGSMVSVALPDMIDGLNAPLRWVGWVITIYSLSQAVSMPITGKLSDELGRRNVFAGGIALFGLASLVAAVAPNVYVLIAARAAQGLAGGSLLPSAYGIIGDAFVQDRARWIGLISSVFPIGSIIGPNVGGLVVEHFGWRWTFAMNVPFVIVAVTAALVLLPASGPRRSRPIDFPGTILLAFSVLGVVYALTEMSRRDTIVNPLVVITAVSVSAVALVAFIHRESHTADPIVDLQLLRRREFMFTNLLNFFYGVTIFGIFSFLPLYAQTAYGMSDAESGALLTPRAIAMIIASTIAAWVLPRTGYRKPIIFGLVVAAGSLIVLSRGIHDPVWFGVQLNDFAFLSLIIGITGIAFGTAGPAANNAAIELLPDRIAAITGLRGMFRSLGGTLGTALIVLLASRAPTQQQGLEEAFLGLAVVSLITIVFVFGIPDGVGGRREQVIEAPPLPGPPVLPTRPAVAPTSLAPPER